MADLPKYPEEEPDLYCDIIYNYKKDLFKITTNIKPELVEDYIAEWVLMGQVGKGADNSKPNKKNIYHIRITHKLDYDTVSIKSDTGNKGLTTGIIMHAVRIGALEPSKLEKQVEK